jgi:hypothetical protein
MTPRDDLGQFLIVLGTAALGVGCGLVASTVGHPGRFDLAGLNYHYSPLGWCFRILCFTLGIVAIALSWRGNPILKSRKHLVLGLLLGFVCLTWEFVVAGVILGFVVLVLATVVSGN